LTFDFFIFTFDQTPLMPGATADLLTRRRPYRNLFLGGGILLLCGITVALDLIYARWQQSAFYLSESLLFSTFWLLALPLLLLQRRLRLQLSARLAPIALVAAATALHLLAYPALVWILSRCFFEHTFSYGQTFHFGLTEHTVKALLLYSLPFLPALFHRNALETLPGTPVPPASAATPAVTALLVPDSGNRKVSIQLAQVRFFSAYPPYVKIHHQEKTYLLPGTLRALEARLDGGQFLRIHKSYIVNVQAVASCRSRLNGDYDLSLADGTVLRLSRHYATAFRARFEEGQRLGSK
jgi:hypothetical protein